MPDNSYIGKRVEPATLVLLSIVTCGIYGAYWLYLVGQDVNRMLGREAISPVIAIIGIFCSPVLLVYLYMLDRELEQVGKQREVPYAPNFVMWLVLALVCYIGPFVAIFQISSFLNAVWDKGAASGSAPLQ